MNSSNILDLYNDYADLIYGICYKNSNGHQPKAEEQFFKIFNQLILDLDVKQPSDLSLRTWVIVKTIIYSEDDFIKVLSAKKNSFTEFGKRDL